MNLQVTSAGRAAASSMRLVRLGLALSAAGQMAAVR